MIALVESDPEIAVREFEERFAERVGCTGAVAVCSGTVALEIALQDVPPELQRIQRRV